MKLKEKTIRIINLLLNSDSYVEREIDELELDIRRFKWELENSESEVRREMSKELINNWKMKIKILRGER